MENKDWTEEDLKEFMRALDPWPIEYTKSGNHIIVNGPEFYGHIPTEAFHKAMEKAANEYIKDLKKEDE